MSNLVLYRVHC